MERLATHYLDEIKRLQPEGPHLLAGFSFGGVTAYEMARQLAAAGRPPALVVLIDSIAPDAVRDRFATSPLKRWRRQAKVEWKWFAWKLGWARWTVARRVFPKAAGSSWRIHEKQGGLTKRAMSHYHPGPYDGRVLLLCSEEASSADRGWAPLLGARLEVVDVPGIHDTVLTPPNVDVLAEKLSKALADAVASAT
jgi:phthiocerol/phenolphthiocerol synthesis type-I polyketide synthase D